jgi:hypothetical protein
LHEWSEKSRPKISSGRTRSNQPKRAYEYMSVDDLRTWIAKHRRRAALPTSAVDATTALPPAE